MKKLVVYPDSFKVAAMVFSALTFFFSYSHFNSPFAQIIFNSTITYSYYHHVGSIQDMLGLGGVFRMPFSFVFPASLRKGAVVIPFADEECEGLGGDCPKSLQPENRDAEQILISWSLV